MRGPIDKWVLGDAQHRPEHLGGATNIQEHVLPKPPVGAAPNDKLVKEKHPQGPGDFVPERMGKKRMPIVVQKSHAKVRGPIDKWVLRGANHRPEHLGSATNIQEHVLPKPPVGAAPNDKLVKEKHPQGPEDEELKTILKRGEEENIIQDTENRIKD